MALSNHLIRLVVHSSTHNPSSRLIYRPRSEQLVEYLTHASKPDKQKNEQSEREPAPSGADEQKRAQEREYIEHRLKEIRAWERKISGRN